MITTLKDEDGRVICYCEWRLVGKSGYDKPDGEYVFVNDLWVHNNFRYQHRINRIIDEVMRQVPTAQFCYFKRGKYNWRTKMFSREYFERRRNAYDSISQKVEA